MAVKKSSERLQVVLRLAQIKQRQAAERLAEAARSLAAHRQQAQQLQDYQGEYNQKFHQLSQQQMNSLELRNYQRFYNNLDEAIDTQHRRSDVCAEQLEFHRKHWQKEYGREKNMEKLIGQKQRLEEKQLESKLQRVLDDRSQRGNQFKFD